MAKIGESGGALRLTVVEVQRSDLGAAVIEEAWRRDEARRRGDGDNVPLALREHPRQEFLDQHKVRYQVHLEESLKFVRRGLVG